MNEQTGGGWADIRTNGRTSGWLVCPHSQLLLPFLASIFGILRHGIYYCKGIVKYLFNNILHTPKFQKLKPEMAKEVDCANVQADNGQAGKQASKWGWETL